MKFQISRDKGFKFSIFRISPISLHFFLSVEPLYVIISFYFHPEFMISATILTDITNFLFWMVTFPVVPLMQCTFNNLLCLLDLKGQNLSF